MKTINDRIRAKRLLEARRHGFAILPFMRLNARRYAFCSVPFAAILLVLALSGSWHAFGLGFRGQRNVWPFAMKIINWDVVQKLSEDEPSA